MDGTQRLVVDTSVVVEAIVPNTPTHRDLFENCQGDRGVGLQGAQFSPLPLSDRENRPGR